MLTGKMLHAVWAASYDVGRFESVGKWEDDSEESRRAWDAVAVWMEEMPRHKKSCPVRNGERECSC